MTEASRWVGWKSRLWAAGVGVAIAGWGGGGGLRAQGFLADEQRTNGVETLGALDPLRARAAAVTVWIGPERDKASLMGVLFGPGGYVLTKATETQPMKSLIVWFPDGARSEARLVKREERLDLALLKVDRAGGSGVAWGESLSLRPGQWLFSLAGREARMRVGVVSANRRPIPNSGAVMGVRFAPAEKGDEGVLIEEVATDGPAERAGLRAGDVLVKINGQRVDEGAAVKAVISKLKPGDLAKVKYLRLGAEGECEVRLASRNRVMMNWGGEDFANHGTSHRTDNFPEVIQHDLPLDPADMGGAVFDLEGRAVGLNVARVDRVTNYALPAEVFLPEVRRWIEEDRSRK